MSIMMRTRRTSVLPSICQWNVNKETLVQCGLNEFDRNRREKKRAQLISSFEEISRNRLILIAPRRISHGIG